MSLGMDIINKKDLPKCVSISNDQLSRCEQFLVISYVGVEYYIPITKEVSKVMKLFESKRFNTRTEDFFRDVIIAVYMQIRDSIGADIHQQLSEQIKDGFENIFNDSLSKTITKKLNQKMLPEKKKENDE